MIEAIIVILIVSALAYYVSLRRNKNSGFEAPERGAASKANTPKKALSLDYVPGISSFIIKFSGSMLETTVKSSSNESVKYAVDMCAQTCTCPDFVETRSEFEIGNPKRFCKHMVRAVVKSSSLRELPPVFQMVFKNAYEMGKGLTRDALYLTEIDGSQVLISHPENSEWINVFCRNRIPKKDGTYNFKRFGFNLAERRWSYGYGPPGAKILRQIFQKLN